MIIFEIILCVMFLCAWALLSFVYSKYSGTSSVFMGYCFGIFGFILLLDVILSALQT